MASTSPDATNGDVYKQLSLAIRDRTHVRIRRLEIRAVGDRVVLHGTTESYYGLQLALATVESVLDALEGDFPEEVEVHIDVGEHHPMFRVTSPRASNAKKRR